MSLRSKNPPAIIPAVKKYTPIEGRGFTFNRGTSISAARPGAPECRFLRERLRRITGFNFPAAENSAGRGVNTVAMESAGAGCGARNTEDYALEADTDSIRLKADSPEGFLYAAGTLSEIIEREKNAWVVRCCEIRDRPDFSWRGLMIDPAREFIPVETVMLYIDYMAQNKLNVLHIHFSDSKSFTLESKKYPAMNRPADTSRRSGSYSPRAIAEIVSFAEKRGVSIVPEIDIPGHATHILNVLPEAKCRVDSGLASNWTMCAGAEETYEILDNLFGEFAPLFPSDYFHIGADELEFRDMPDRVNTSWRNCRVCGEAMKREGLADFRQLFYYFIRRTRGILEKYNKKVMMWNDNIDINSSPDLPRDILIHFWRIAAKGRGPRKGCSMAKFLRNGFKAVNSFYPETYIYNYVKEENLFTWNPVKRPPVPEQLREAVLGGEMCAWSDHCGPEFYRRLLPPALALFGDRTWNKQPGMGRKHFAPALPGHILGPNAGGGLEDLFDALGGIIPASRTETQADAGSSLAGLTAGQKKKKYAELEKIIGEKLSSGNIFNPEYARECLETIKRLRERDNGT